MTKWFAYQDGIKDEKTMAKYNFFAKNGKLLLELIWLIVRVIGWILTINE
jgi:hypothetical protein